MDRKIGIVGSIINLIGVVGFAVGMITGPLNLCYITSILIAWGLVMMTCGFCRFGRHDAKAAALCALVFCGMYAFCNSLVYFTQLTTVTNDLLNAQAKDILAYSRFGLMFDLDMLGYCLMAVSTFFAGLTIKVQDKGDKALKILLMIHGVFAISCFIIPMLGIFKPDIRGASWIGTAVLEFWCAYFTPVGLLSVRYFKRITEAEQAG